MNVARTVAADATQTLSRGRVATLSEPTAWAGWGTHAATWATTLVAAMALSVGSMRAASQHLALLKQHVANSRDERGSSGRASSPAKASGVATAAAANASRFMVTATLGFREQTEGNHVRAHRNRREPPRSAHPAMQRVQRKQLRAAPSPLGGLNAGGGAASSAHGRAGREGGDGEHGDGRHLQNGFLVWTRASARRSRRPVSPVDTVSSHLQQQSRTESCPITAKSSRPNR